MSEQPEQYATQSTSWYFDSPPEETLLDKIAMAALPVVMQELIALEVYNTSDDDLATRCYAIAKAFMKARGK